MVSHHRHTRWYSKNSKGDRIAIIVHENTTHPSPFSAALVTAICEDDAPKRHEMSNENSLPTLDWTRHPSNANPVTAVAGHIFHSATHIAAF